MARLPVIIVNFKAYSESLGRRAVKLAKICERVAIEKDVNIMVAVQLVDLKDVIKSVSIPVLAQHVDSEMPGAHTGFVTAESVRDAGAYGTLLNHSEHRLRLDMLYKSIQISKENGLFTVVCANNIEQGKAVGEFMPDLVAIEPPELIGGNLSVTSADPDLVRDAVLDINEMLIDGKLKHFNRVIVGAGIKTKEDVKKSIELGAVGVLIASGIVKAKDPYKELCNLADALK